MHLAVGKLRGEIKGFPSSFAKHRAFLCRGAACSMTTTQPLKARGKQAAKSNKEVIWLARQSFKKA